MQPTEDDWRRAALVCREVAELPDRTSPDDNADFMLVMGEELQPMVAQALADAREETVPIDDFLTLYDAAHAVIDKITMHIDHAEYEGGMNDVERFREIAADLRWKHADKVRDPFTGDLPDDDER